MMLSCRMMRVEWVEGLQLTSVQKDLDASLRCLPSRKKSMKHEFDVSCSPRKLAY